MFWFREVHFKNTKMSDVLTFLVIYFGVVSGCEDPRLEIIGINLELLRNSSDAHLLYGFSKPEKISMTCIFKRVDPQLPYLLTLYDADRKVIVDSGYLDTDNRNRKECVVKNNFTLEYSDKTIICEAMLPLDRKPRVFITTVDFKYDPVGNGMKGPGKSRELSSKRTPPMPELQFKQESKDIGRWIYPVIAANAVLTAALIGITIYLNIKVNQLKSKEIPDHIKFRDPEVLPPEIEYDTVYSHRFGFKPL